MDQRRRQHDKRPQRRVTLTRTEDVSYDELRQRPERLDNDNAPED